MRIRWWTALCIALGALPLQATEFRSFSATEERMEAALYLLDQMPRPTGTYRVLCYNGDLAVGKYGPVGRGRGPVYLAEGSSRRFPASVEEADPYDRDRTDMIMFTSRRYQLRVRVGTSQSLERVFPGRGFFYARGSLKNRISGRVLPVDCLLDIAI